MNPISYKKAISSKFFDKIIVNLDYPIDVRFPENYFIADISGKDSIAALLKTIEGNSSAIIIPSIIELACEYGDKAQYSKVIRKLNAKFNRTQKKIMPGIISDVNNLWRAVVPTGIQNSIKRFRFYSPCIPCHLVFHIVRIKIAKHLKVQHVISGEREIHSDKEKINQIDFVLDFYNSIYDLMGIKHHLPLRYIADNKEINRIIDSHNADSIWLDCLFAGNYYKSGTNKFTMTKSYLRNYVNQYLTRITETFDKEITISCKVVG